MSMGRPSTRPVAMWSPTQLILPNQGIWQKRCHISALQWCQTITRWGDYISGSATWAHHLRTGHLRIVLPNDEILPRGALQEGAAYLVRMGWLRIDGPSSRYFHQTPLQERVSYLTHQPQPGYPGIQQALSHLSSSDEIQIEDKMDGEQESFPGDQQLALDGQGLGTELRDVILGALKGVTEGTAAHYERLMAQCKKFAIEKMFIRADGEVFTKAPH
ncbi:hypothetical protein BDN71DRAFT_1498024 [Pleurotus eryngii]|uniref:Uncharacterized protein n=1 Tax=Pleurotus eryngii TaxID=5323 RepID=A0A9P5ZQX5_PLEER|nr:hypothetical protein BDN71DRAFT_1498024 [Pleurotus eryngii]